MITRVAKLSGGALLASALWCQAADLHRVAGVVVNAQTGAPLPHARVAVVRGGTTRLAASLVTGADGRFSFDLPEGKYELHGGPGDMLDIYGQPAPDIPIGSAVMTGPGQNTSNLVFRWFPRGAISGRIVDETGEPVEGALVQLIRSTVRAGRWVTATFAWGRTDDRGEYRLGPLIGGTYYLAVAAEPWYSKSSLFGRQAVVPSTAYRPAYYPNTIEMARAAPLLLTSGEEARADFTLRTVPGATVSVECDDPQTLTGNIALIRDGIGGSEGLERQQNANALGQVLQNVPPGHYLVRVMGTNANSLVVGQQWIDVSGIDVTVKLSLKPAPAVSGAVELKDPDSKPRGSMLVSLVRVDTAQSMRAAVQPDGSFSLRGVPVGRYRPVIRGADGYFASEIHVDGADFREGVLDLVPGASVTLRMVASGETGHLGGFVMRGEQPVEGALVVLAPEKDTIDPHAYYGFQTESDGSFDYENIPAGEYLLFATDDPKLEYTNPAAIRPYLANAKPIRIQPHGSYSARIPLAERPAAK